jgi:hypothetical protein
MKTLNQPCNTGTGLSGTCNDWHPMKGPMMTQTLIGSVGPSRCTGAATARTSAAFSVGFTGSSAPTIRRRPRDGELEAFLATIRFQPNPHRPSPTPAAVGPGLQRRSRERARRCS